MNCGMSSYRPLTTVSMSMSAAAADPVTFAGATAAMPKGTIIYIWGLKKYFILEDDCEVRGSAMCEALGMQSSGCASRTRNVYEPLLLGECCILELQLRRYHHSFLF